MDCQTEQDIKSLIETIKLVALSHSLDKNFHLNITFKQNIEASAGSIEKQLIDLVKDKDKEKIDIGALKHLLTIRDYDPTSASQSSPHRP
jgi:ATP-dependent protease HslVU (ClpYQ) peptidase subunit